MSDHALFDSELYKKEANYADYYRASLRFLGCTTLDTLSQQDKMSQAYHLCLAALLGKDIYNFGELLAHKILDSLRETPQQWVVDLLVAFNSGDVGKFESMSKEWSTVSDLAANRETLANKICLLALMEMTFQVNTRRVLGGMTSESSLDQRRFNSYLILTLFSTVISQIQYISDE